MSRHVTDHARERAEERFGRDLTSGEWEMVASSIMEGKATMTRVQGDTRHYIVNLGDFVFQALWSHHHRRVITVKPMDFSLSKRINKVKHAKLKGSTTRRAPTYIGGRLMRGANRPAR